MLIVFPSRAKRTKTNSRIPPTQNRGVERSRRQTSIAREVGFARSGTTSASGSVEIGISVAMSDPHSRVERGIEDFGQSRGQEREHCDEEDGACGGVDVGLQDRVDGELAHAVPGEDDLQ